MASIVPQKSVRPEMFNGLKIIDSDAHFTEPADLWQSRVPASLKDQVPVLKTVDGVTHWYLNGERWCDIGGNTVRHGREKMLGKFRHQPFEDLDPAAWSVKERVRFLDETGIFAQVLYPNAVGFSSNFIADIEDTKQRKLILQTYNDFNVDMQVESNGRLFPQCILPFWDIDLAVAEMKRLIDKGIRGFTLSDRPEALGLPSLIDPYFDPLWEIFNDTGAVANFHIAAGLTKEEVESLRAATMGTIPPEDDSARSIWKGIPRQRAVAAASAQQFMSTVKIITNLCFSNLFDRYPKLKIMLVESGVGWVPFVLEAMDYQFSELVTEKDEREYAKRKPSEYFHDHLYTSFWFERAGLEEAIVKLGAHHVMLETDFPHPTCLYPNAMEYFAKSMKDFDPAMIKKVAQDNAAQLYQIKV